MGWEKSALTGCNRFKDCSGSLSDEEVSEFSQCHFIRIACSLCEKVRLRNNIEIRKRAAWTFHRHGVHRHLKRFSLIHSIIGSSDLDMPKVGRHGFVLQRNRRHTDAANTRLFLYIITRFALIHIADVRRITGDFLHVGGQLRDLLAFLYPRRHPSERQEQPCYRSLHSCLDNPPISLPICNTFTSRALIWVSCKP